jgi:hypothetical protein
LICNYVNVKLRAVRASPDSQKKARDMIFLIKQEE